MTRIVTQRVPAAWLLTHPEAIGASWLDGNCHTIIGGVDALVDGSKVILEYCSTGERLVEPTFQIEVSQTVYEQLNSYPGESCEI